MVTSSPQLFALAPELSERDVRILAFERDWSAAAGPKEDSIRTQFGVSVTRYYQLLNAVIDLPAAVRHDPMLVGRLLRARHDRLQLRQQRAFAPSYRRPVGPDEELTI